MCRSSDRYWYLFSFNLFRHFSFILHRHFLSFLNDLATHMLCGRYWQTFSFIGKQNRWSLVALGRWSLRTGRLTHDLRAGEFGAVAYSRWSHDQVWLYILLFAYHNPCIFLFFLLFEYELYLQYDFFLPFDMLIFIHVILVLRGPYSYILQALLFTQGLLVFLNCCIVYDFVCTTNWTVSTCFCSRLCICM